MRIIAGEHKGRRIAPPKGKGTRPTTDRVRESLMSAVANARGGFEGAEVLDAFAGSGALGLESLSRGACHCTFFEKDKGALIALKANIAALGIGADRATVCQGDVLAKAPALQGHAFDLVFLDPPYQMDVGMAAGLAKSLYDRALLGESPLIVYEHAKADGPQLAALAASLQWEGLFHRVYGDTAVDIFSW